MRSASTSTLPVSIVGLTVCASRVSTNPSTATTHQVPRRFAAAAGPEPGRTTICVTPR